LRNFASSAHSLILHSENKGQSRITLDIYATLLCIMYVKPFMTVGHVCFTPDCLQSILLV